MISSLIELDEDLLVPFVGLYARYLSGKSSAPAIQAADATGVGDSMMVL